MPKNAPKRALSKGMIETIIDNDFGLIFIYFGIYFSCTGVYNQPANGLRYLRWGGTGEPRPARKRLWRRKLLEMCAESPASGARFVGRILKGV